MEELWEGPDAYDRSAETRMVRGYAERICLALLKDNYRAVTEICQEIFPQSVMVRAAVWSCLPTDVRMRLQDICPHLL